MKILKKFLAAFSAVTVLICGTAISDINADADASMLSVRDILALHKWTEYLESVGVPFSSMGVNGKYIRELYDELDEKVIGTPELYYILEHDPVLARFLRENSFDEDKTNINFCILMLAAQGNYKSNEHRCRPGKSVEMDEECRKLEEQGYTWDGSRWNFDIEEYLSSHGDYESYPSIEYSYTSAVSSSLVLSGNTATCQSMITGNGRTTRIIVTQYLEKRSDNRWRIVKVWSKAASANRMTLTNSMNVKGGSYRLRTVFRVYSGNNFETITRYSNTKELMTRSADNDTEEDYSLYDINNDGVFDIDDAAAMQKALSANTAEFYMDVNGDGKVNVFDLVAVKRMLSDDDT